MVYAQDLSSNGTTLIRYYQDQNGNMHADSRVMNQHSGPVLLIDGDRLELSPAVSILFNESRTCAENDLDLVMSQEIKAR